MKTIIDTLIRSFQLTILWLLITVIFFVIGRINLALISAVICGGVCIIQLIVYQRNRKIDRIIEDYNQNIDKWMNRK